MRVLALGGAGEMGRVAARVLRADSRVTNVTIADRDESAACRVAAELGAEARGLDVTDAAALAHALRQVDIVVNTVGPYFRFGPPILAAAIAAGCDYIDICDDPQPTIEMLELGARAKAAGVTALLGMGASPGVANLLALRAGAELDRVDSLITGWNIHSAHPASETTGPTAAVVHGMRQISGNIPVTRHRTHTERPALQRVRFDYPGLGPSAGRSFGHPEAITLPLAFPDVREATSVAVGDRSTSAALLALRWAINRRLLTVDRAAGLAARAERLLPADPATLVAAGRLPPLFAIATGVRDGSEATVATALCQVPGLSMAENTGVPLAIGALLLSMESRPGVHVPETLLDPDRFFAAFAPHCIGLPDPSAMTVTTRSWAGAEANAAALSSALLTALVAAG
ncbi:saccharopine dehydrogenase family protein [Nocardia alba]|uniref:Saccharopine dehydrogenase-like NADP-dependent oxidoreductase n=1 Tax=Nocardia alba TaxID=225051 RepID=A0A4R1G0Y3_9NOCA|nr:saccharopine dehydrogenase NADP-binding domain-containing protein [Nocardia alba]TCK01228.1 saccharopine dehydrogenase-like NADP-dependent oxidoreductase [Nocardia alba]